MYMDINWMLSSHVDEKLMVDNMVIYIDAKVASHVYK